MTQYIHKILNLRIDLKLNLNILSWTYKNLFSQVYYSHLFPKLKLFEHKSIFEKEDYHDFDRLNKAS